MKVILLEKVRRLGNLGDVVSVKPGYGRNFLIPQGKATSATAGNLAKFEARRAEIERLAQEAFKAAQERAGKLAEKVFTIMAKTGEEGKLFGSIGTGDISKVIQDNTKIEVARSEVKMPLGAIRQTGEYDIELHLHSDVIAQIKVIVAAEV